MLTAHRLRKSYGEVIAVDEVNADIAAGAITAIIGANGAGKTTLLRMLAGDLAPSSGEVKTPQPTAFVDQDPSLDPEMTGGETLRLFAALHGVTLGETRFGIDEILPRLVATYSGGQKRRLHLAAALLHSPNAIFLDEPTAGLDGEGARLLWAELDRRAQAGATVVVVGHDLDEIEREAASVLVMHRGKIVARGTPSDLMATHGRTWLRVTLREKIDVPELPSGFSQAQLEGRRLWVQADDSARIDDLLAMLPVADVAVHRRDLASVYRTLTESELPSGKRRR